MADFPLATEHTSRLGAPEKTLINMFFEPTAQGPRDYMLKGRPGLVRPDASSGMDAALGSGPVTLIETYGLSNYVLSGGDLYLDGANIGSLATGGYQQAARSLNQFVIVSGYNAYLVDSSATQITDPDLPDVIGVVYLGGYWVYPQRDSSTFYYSAVDDATSIDALDFVSAEVSADTIARFEVVGGEIWSFGFESIEYLGLTGNANAPFRPAAGRSQNVGCLAPMSVVPADNGVYFLGQYKGMGRGVFRTEGLQARRISTPAIDAMLDATTGLTPLSAKGILVQMDGHQFYVLTMPGEATYAYDIATGRWAKWETYDGQVFRLLAGNGRYFGDVSGNIYEFSPTAYDDDGATLSRVASCFVPAEGNERHASVQLICETGVGLASGTGSNPMVELRYTDDLRGGWSDWLPASLGLTGVYEARAEWRQLGVTRNPGRLYEVRCTDPVSFTPFKLRVNPAR